jgi:hypothetical protein
MQKFWIRITLLIIISIPALWRLGNSAEFQTWSDITTIYIFSDRWRYDGDQGTRGLLSQSDFTLLYFRPSVRYRINPWITAHGGIRFFQTIFDDDEDTFEIGPWQGLRIVPPLFGSYAISHYFRLEERMTWETGEESDFDFTVRARYQLGARSPNYDILLKNGIYLSGSIEAFSDIETPIFIDRMRYDAGVGTKLTDAWRVELRYLFQHGRRSSSSSFGNDEHILRLRFFYRFN